MAIDVNVQNERTRLTATWVNNVAAATVAAGTISPLAALAYGFMGAHRAAWIVAALSGAWILAGAGLHAIARAILGSLRP
jgi:hypothetical protein